MVLELPAGGYTAWVSGAGGQTGIGLVEIFEVAEVSIPPALGNYLGLSSVTLSNCQNPANDRTFGFSSAVNMNSQNGSLINGTGMLTGPTAVNLNLSGTATAGGDVMGSFSLLPRSAAGMAHLRVR